MLKRTLIGAAVTAGLCTIMYAGISERQVTLEHCKASVKRYVIAHFSEDYACPRTDSKGNTYLDVCENTWTESVSHTITTVTFDGKGKGPFFKDGYYFSQYPPITKDVSNHYAFDGYERSHHVSMRRIYNDDTSISTNDYLQCLIDIGSTVRLRTVFGLTLWEI